MSDPATTDPYADQRGARVFRWIGALAVFGIVIVALAILAFEAVGDAVVFVGDGVDTPAAESDAEPADTAGAGDPTGDAAPAEDEGGDDPATDGDGAGPGGAGTYEVQPGDTGSSIARDIYGSQAAWEEIAAYNDLDPTVTLNVGQQLNLPPR